MQSTFLGSQARCSPLDMDSGKRHCGQEGSKCLLVRLSKEVALSSSPPCLRMKPDAWFSRFVSLSLSLPTTEQRESNLPWSLIFPHWPRPGLQGRRQKQQPSGWLLDFGAFAFSHVSRSASTRGSRGGRRQARVQAKLQTSS